MFDPTNVPAESTGSAQVLSAFRAGVTSPEQLRQVEQAGKDVLTSLYQSAHRHGVTPPSQSPPLSTPVPTPIPYQSASNVGQLLQQSQALGPVGGRVLSPTPENLGYSPSMGVGLSKGETATRIIAALIAGVTSPDQLQQVERAGKEVIESLYKGIPTQPEHQSSIPKPYPNDPEPPRNPPSKSLGGRLLDGGRFLGERLGLGGGGSGVEVAKRIADTLSSHMDRWANRVNLVNNRNVAGFNKAQQFAEEIPVVGQLIGSLRRLRDAIDGTTEQIRRDKEKHEENLIRIGLENQREVGVADLRRQEFSSVVSSQVYGSARPSYYSPTDRSTGRGAIDYQEEQARLGATDRRDEASRRVEIANQEVRFARNRVYELTQDINARRGRRDAANRRVTELHTAAGNNVANLTSSRNNAEYQRLLQQIAEDNERILNQTRQLQTANEQLSQSEINGARSRSELRRENIALLQTEIGTLQNRENLLVSSAQRVARATPHERRLAVQLGERARERGIESLQPQQRDFLERFAPSYVGAELTRVGEDLPEHAYFRDVMGEAGSGGIGQSIAGTRQQVNNLQAQVRNEIIIDSAQVARETAAALGPAIERYIQAINTQITTQINNLITGRLITANSSGS